jgi:predicted flavoprotein YhiN
LSRYTQHDFRGLVERLRNRLSRENAGPAVLRRLRPADHGHAPGEMRLPGAQLRLGTRVDGVEKTAEGFAVSAAGETVNCAALVVATGGKSIPKMGASGSAMSWPSVSGSR